MSRRFDCTDTHERVRALREAVTAVGRGRLVVLPTDTVYGIGCDAFQPDAVKALLDAKGRGRDMPAPVLVGSVRAAEALIEDLGGYGEDLIDEFWPGALTIVCKAAGTLAWDLGDTKGTVAVRMPLHPLALELLKRTGPMAVSSANISGSPPARTAKDAEAQLGDSIDVYLDDGPVSDGPVSSIVDLTGPVPRLLRAGAITDVRLREVCGVLATDEDATGADGTGADKADEDATGGDETGADKADKADEDATGADGAGADKADEDATGGDETGADQVGADATGGGTAGNGEEENRGAETAPPGAEADRPSGDTGADKEPEGPEQPR